MVDGGRLVEELALDLGPQLFQVLHAPALLAQTPLLFVHRIQSILCDVLICLERCSCVRFCVILVVVAHVGRLIFLEHGFLDRLRGD